MIRPLDDIKRRGFLRRVLCVLVLAAAGPVAAPAQPVQGDVRSVGFQAAVPSRFIVRPGQWFPILVHLTGQGSEAYDVELRCEGSDLDGDRVSYVREHVAVNPGSVRRVWCYAVMLGDSFGQTMDLDVIGADGALITSLRLPMFEFISNDTQLILDISGKRFTGLDAVDSDAMAYAGPAWGNRTFYRSICVAALPAQDLPDRWWGLEAVDVIVWDEPAPKSLNNSQLAALVEWVRNGGQLIVGLGPAWMEVQKSPLGAIMPLTGSRSTVEVQTLDTFLRRFARAESARFKAPISVAVGEPAVDTLVTFQDQLPDKRPFNLIAMRTVGCGRVIATAARLRDLTSVGLWGDFYHALLDLNRNEGEFKDNEGKQYMHDIAALYEPVIAEIEFRRVASVRVLAAFAFVAAYILLSTLGAWTWLKRHALTHVSWTAFAAFAVVASLLSLGAVGLSRGVTGTVDSFSFVDMSAGSTEARATTYFGYKSNRRQALDLSLPGEGNYLRALATGPEPSAHYATPGRYQAVADEAALVATPLRATLKQFEGCWHGNVDGSVRGALTASRRSGQITPESWLQNDLGVELIGGYLLYIDPRLRERDGVPYRVAGLDRRNDRPNEGNKYYGSEKVPPAVNVLALEIPAMQPGERVSELGAEEYADYVARYARWSSLSQREPTSEPMLKTLRHRQLDEWVDSFGALVGGKLAARDAAALLASTRDLYLHNNRVTDFTAIGRPLSTAGLVDQDVTPWLMRGQAVLLLLADDPGPAQLYVDGTPKKIRKGRSIYRVRIPIRYIGQPSRGDRP